MTTEPNAHVDETLREAYAVDEAAADRVIGRALAARPRHVGRTRLRASLALAAVGLSAGLVAWLSRPAIVPPAVVMAPPAATQLSGSFVDGVLIVPIPGDGVVIAGPGRREDRPPDGSGIVFVEGDVR